MIHFVNKKNIFNSTCEAIVCPCNCVGIMGAGLALDFKNRFPDMFKEYKEICSNRGLVPGLLHIYPRKELVFREPDSPHYIINFPTKDHWKDPSKLVYITSGLHILQQKIIEYDIKSIAIPALGCGLGGLAWKDVKYYINQFAVFLNKPEVYIEVYEPKE